MASAWYKRLFAWFKKDKEAIDEQEALEYDDWQPTRRAKAVFRFPLVPDEAFQASRKQDKVPAEHIRTNMQARVETTNDQELEERRKERIQFLKEQERIFAERGWLKKAQDVPSPVYGFHRHPESRLREQEPSDVQVDFANEGERDEITMNDAPLEHSQQHSLVDDNFTAPNAVAVEEVEGQANKRVEDIKQVETSIDKKQTAKVPYNVFYFGAKQSDYQFPKLSFLSTTPPATQEDKQWQVEMVELLEQTLQSFNVQASVTGITRGPTVTRMELQPAPGVKVNRITALSDDIKLNLAARDIRIEAPVPGRAAVGIEIPNLVREPVNIADILASTAFTESKSPLTVALGKDIEGAPVTIDLNKMPHGLIAGSTGSGKSVCINSMIISLLYKARPEEVKLILIDPKMVELAPYHDLPHLATPVVTDPKQATMALKWAVEEMDRRYELFADSGVRDLERYNELITKTQADAIQPALPYIVIIIDELADLMMVAPGDVEESIARIAQKARACGIHLLVATQRPSVDVITGMVKANIPTRIAFSVSSQVDSRTILDAVGAERLLGRGDMLLLENGSNKAVRIQGNFVADDEIEAVCHFVRSQRKPQFLFDKESLVRAVTEEPEDELYTEAVLFVIEQENASTSLLQRKFRIGYNRAARLIDMMQEQGIISEALGSKPRNVLITLEEWEAMNNVHATV